MIQQAIDDAGVVAFGGGRQWPLAARFLVVGEFGIRYQQFAHALLVAHCGGDGNRVARSPLEQLAGDGIVVALLPVRMVPERQHHRPESGSAEAIVAAESRRIHVCAKI